MKTSLDHLPRKKQRELARVVEIIHEEFDTVVKAGTAEWKRRGRIYKIILFGSYARGGWVDEQHVGKGYQSDYDILVIVSHKKLSEGTNTGGSIWRAAEDRIERDRAITTPVQVIVHTLDEVNTELRKGRYFFKEVRADGIALYEFTGSKSSGNRHHALAEPGNLTPKEVYEATKEYFDHWHPSAAGFLDTSRYAQSQKRLNEAAFLLHQATERVYHAILLTLTLYSPPGHNIQRLRGLAEELDQRLIEAWPRGRRPYDRYFDLLRRAYVEARYSKHYEITKEELEWLADRVRHLQTLVETVCTERLAQLKAQADKAAE